ncbi:MAG: respiratory chain complex I subunit 1 family protein [Limisphaerales bacterium]
MENSLTYLVLGVLANMAIVVLAAPLCEGVLRKVTAGAQSRRGPPLLQPYMDLLKLLGKEDIESGEVPAVQRLAAHLSLAVVLVVACLVPLGFPAPMNTAGDVILLIYLLTLAGISSLLGGLAAGSTYSLLGIGREMMAMMTLEPLFAIALLIGAVHARSLRLDAVLNGSVYAAQGFPWSGVLMLGVMAMALQAFVQRQPFDIAEAETELMGGPLVEYSGPKLALFKYAQMVRLLLHCALFVALFVPWGGGFLFYWAKVAVLVLIVTLVAATHARYRIDQAIRYFAGMLALAFCALALAAAGF